jgi:hypothetical protein
MVELVWKVNPFTLVQVLIFNLNSMGSAVGRLIYISSIYVLNNEYVGFDHSYRRELNRVQTSNDGFDGVLIGEAASRPLPKTSNQHRCITFSVADVSWSATPVSGRGALYQRSCRTSMVPVQIALI